MPCIYSEHVASSPETAYTENIASESDVEEKTTGFLSMQDLKKVW